MDFKIKDYISSPIKMISIINTMKKAPYLESDGMNEIVLKKLKELCIYAEHHIPFYKEWFKKANFNPEVLDSFDYFETLPILDKEIIRVHSSEMISDEFKRLGAVACETSGSTGTPLQFYLDKNVNTASFYLFYRTWKTAKKWNILKNQCTISGLAEEKWKYSRTTGILYLSSFLLDDITVNEYYELIKKYKVKFLRGYPSSLYRFAQLVEKNNLELQFDIMFSGAETLLPYQREYIEKVFDGKVIDHYTHWERTASICECTYGRLHAQNDFGYHEIVNETGKSMENGIGRLVCTGLYNKAMPLIRYDTRDLAEWSQEKVCECGCKFPIVKKIIGRIEDIVVTPDGKFIGRLDAAFKYSKNIRLAYIYQPDRYHITVNICPAENFVLEDEQKKLDEELRKRVGKQINIEYKLVDQEDIPYTPSGKVRFVISDVEKELQTTNRID